VFLPLLLVEFHITKRVADFIHQQEIKKNKNKKKKRKEYLLVFQISEQ